MFSFLSFMEHKFLVIALMLAKNADTPQKPYSQLCLASFTWHYVFKVIHVIVWNSIWFLFIAKWYSIACIYHVLFMHASVNGHFDCFTLYLLWIILLWTFVYKFYMTICFHFSWVYTCMNIYFISLPYNC